MKMLSVFKFILPIIGLVLLGTGHTAYQNTSRFVSEAITVQGRVIDHEASEGEKGIVYKSVVEFSGRDGDLHRFLSSIASYPPAYDKGEYVEVIYSPGEPEAARINVFFELWGKPVISLFIGLAFFGGGVGTWMSALIKARQRSVLKKSGVRVAAEFQAVKCNRRFSFNDQHPFFIVCQWQNPETGQRHIFTSENVWFDPEGYINGNTINVYIEPDNPKKYWVDLSFLPR
jgi:hypothetical protein